LEVQTGGMKKMADSNNNFKSTVEALFKGMDAVVSSKTVVGDREAGLRAGKIRPSGKNTAGDIGQRMV